MDSRPDPGPVRLMFLGQLIPRKGVDLALRALSALREQDWEFVVMGTGAPGAGTAGHGPPPGHCPPSPVSAGAAQSGGDRGGRPQ